VPEPSSAVLLTTIVFPGAGVGVGVGGGAGVGVGVGVGAGLTQLVGATKLTTKIEIMSRKRL